MYAVRYGGKEGNTLELDISVDRVAVRTNDRTPVVTERPFETARLSREARDVVQNFSVELRLPEPGVEVIRSRVPTDSIALRDQAREVLKTEPAIRFAGRVLADSLSGDPVLYSENFFVKFAPEVSTSECLHVLDSYHLKVKRELRYARNAYFTEAPEGTGLSVFAIAEELLANERVELCHPELVRQSRNRAFFPQQWHLGRTTVAGNDVNAHANVVNAWSISTGAAVTIAVVDNGIDIDHEEFVSAGKVVSPRDVSRGSDDPRPGANDNHGTACAGVACGNGTLGASGVAPHARLMPIRLTSVLGSQAEADAFVWAADHGADVISCSWGPADGRWDDPSDPRHRAVVPIPDSTRLAIDYAVQHGRADKGCVVFFAAGNGNESVDNDGYASYSMVMAVAACNDHGVRSAYSDFGRAVWCTFPSNDGIPSLTSGIWTTDRSGAAGYNPGTTARGDAVGNYTNSFGGTSSAAPGAAGVAALILSRSPQLTAAQVRDIIRRACDRIDVAGGQYDSNGHSPLYGYGRLNAESAVRLSAPAQPDPVGVHSIVQDVPILDLHTSKLSLGIAETIPVRAVQIGIDIEHTYIGDLIIRVVPPPSTGVPSIVLHNRTGGATRNLRRVYDAAAVPALATILNKNASGIWTLEVRDEALEDQGMIRGFRVEFTH